MPCPLKVAVLTTVFYYVKVFMLCHPWLSRWFQVLGIPTNFAGPLLVCFNMVNSFKIYNSLLEGPRWFQVLGIPTDFAGPLMVCFNMVNSFKIYSSLLEGPQASEKCLSSFEGIATTYRAFERSLINSWPENYYRNGLAKFNTNEDCDWSRQLKLMVSKVSNSETKKNSRPIPGNNGQSGIRN